MKDRITTLITVVLLFVIGTIFCRPGIVESALIVHTDKEMYSQAEAIRVIFHQAPGYDRDWLCIVPAGSADTDAGDYQYLPGGANQGILIFAPRPAGSYEARAYYNYRQNGYVVSRRYAFSIVSDSAQENTLSQSEEPAEPDSAIASDIPPSIPFASGSVPSCRRLS